MIVLLDYLKTTTQGVPITVHKELVCGTVEVNFPILCSSFDSQVFKVTFCRIFTESALRPIQSISRDVRMCVCLFVCPSHPRNHASRRIRDLWSKGVSLILAYL